MPFGQAFKEVSRGVKKFKQNEYRETGRYPIIDQGNSRYAGYSNEIEGLFTNVPAIVFGDHTRIVKYLDQPFFVGADGVKILRPLLSDNVRYWYHALRSTSIENLGYSRHFKLLKEKSFANPTPDQQILVCNALDAVLSQIHRAKKASALLDTLVKSRFVEMFGRRNTSTVPLKDCCSKIQGGKTPSMKRPDYYGGPIPFIKSGDVRGDAIASGALWLSETALKSGGVKLAPQGSLLVVTRSALLRRKLRAAICSADVAINQDIKAFTPKDGYIGSYLLWAVRLHEKELLTSVRSVSTCALDFNDLCTLPIVNASQTEQQEFADFVAQVDKSRFVLSRNLRILKLSMRTNSLYARWDADMNFDFLKREDGYYNLFADACIEAEKICATSPAMCAVGCRKALELAVKWVYAIDNSISMPYRDNLSSLLHERSFMDAVDERVWRKLIGINKLGNLSVHTERTVKLSDAVLALSSLFEFTDWIDYCYGPDYVTRSFDEAKIPRKGIQLDANQIKAIKARESLLSEKEVEIKRLEAKIRKMSARATQAKEDNKRTREFNPEDISEYETRKHYIDWDLALAGWKLGGNVIEEREVHGMPVEPGKTDGTGFVDYLLNGKDGRPLAILEAKKTTYSIEKGLQQARLYAICLEREVGYKPPIFLSNGFETLYVDDESGASRQVSGIFSQDDLQKILNRKTSSIKPSELAVDEQIAGGGRRYYQIEAIQRTCANIEAGHRKSLLVMATGTGKTRVSAALADVLMRSGNVKNVLFLADRVALVRQAKHAYQSYLPNASLCNLCSNKDERNARIVFSTYPTIMNAIDKERNEDGDRMFTPAHFDLVIIDEAHRSIFKKYRAIFDYFDSLLVGLTATPADDVDRNTYDFFDVERGVPTYVYEYKTATEVDHVLVPYLGIETHTNFIDNGITYNELSPEEREQLDDDFEDAGQDTPEEILPDEINRWIFNEGTVDNVLETLMDKGIHTQGGQVLGKTVIFAQSQAHARFIVKRFGELYPSLPGDYIKAVVHSDDYSHTVIDDFEVKPLPVITVSVDMMDTGVDVPEIVNLVFFKKVRSKIKFWQMIGRGTRLCEGLEVMDPLNGPHEDKERFFIFDWCRNFAYFNENPNVSEGKLAVTVAEEVFCRQAELAKVLQESAYSAPKYQNWRKELVNTLRSQVVALNDDLFTVRLHRREVEIYRREESYQIISATALSELKRPISMLVVSDEDDFYALRFDNLMYGYMVSLVNGQNARSYKRRVLLFANRLMHVATIPQVKKELPFIERIADGQTIDKVGLLGLEEIRKRLRSLIKLVPTEEGRRSVFTHLDDPVIQITYGVSADIGEDFESYKLKVERYLKDYGGNLVINKLRTNKPMTEYEFQQLERIFTQELGNAEDYAKAFGDTPFGLLVRKVAHLDRDAAMEAFADFLNDQSLSEQQISFIKRVVDYVVENGYMEPGKLNQAPFDRPQPFIRIFNAQQQASLVKAIRTMNENATTPAA